MRTIVVFTLFLASVAAKGSGPYLPSGWRPQGPAFYLPSEVEKPKDNPIKEIVYQESEASGSDSFQEYGPPKGQEVFQELSKQGLPDAVIEQTFATFEQKVEQNEIKEVAVTESQAVTEELTTKKNQESEVQEIVSVTETLALDEITSTVAEPEVITENTEKLPSAEVTTQFSVVIDATQEVQQEIKELTSTEQLAVNEQEDKKVEAVPQENENAYSDIVSIKKLEAVQQENENANSDIVSTIEERIKIEEVQTVKEEVQKIETEVKRIETEAQKVETEVHNFEKEVNKMEQVVQNIPELLINIENENKKQQAEKIEEITEAKAIQETFGSLEQAPEGFLEYGPPGFKEYGPPKDEILRAAAEEISPELQSIEINETRKRRLSPKFRVARKVNKN